MICLVTVLCSLVTRLPIKTGREGGGTGQSIARVLGWQIGTAGHKREGGLVGTNMKRNKG